MTYAAPSSPNRPVALWLVVCCTMVFVMALLGAVTRLTESGLSITDWQPVAGALPPLNDGDWNRAFDGYKQIPQYQVLHRGMTLEEFKGIFFWEWFHRLWGRLIGVAFALPLIVFAARRQIDRRLALHLVAIFAIGGLQGFIGWFMVKSGLSVRTSVSPYRLALHLGFALFIYALMLRQALILWPVRLAEVSVSCRRFGFIVLGFLAVTMIWGAFVAGLHAGEAYNTWPLMDGDVLPSAAFTLLPKWLNIFENLALVQFIHRWLAPITGLLALFWAHRLRRDLKNSPERNLFWPNALAAMVCVQIALGLSTLLTHANIVLATLHQGGAITLLTLVLINLWRIRPRG